MDVQETAHALFDAIRGLVSEAVRIGVSVETALDAFHEKYFPHVEGTTFGAAANYGSLPPEAQSAVDEAVKQAPKAS